MTRRWGLIATGIVTVLLLLAMSPAEERMQERGPGMVPFELTGGQDRADEILAEWGEEGRDAARESLWIDFGFLVAYGAFLTLALAAVRDLARRRGWRRMTASDDAGGAARPGYADVVGPLEPSKSLPARIRSAISFDSAR